MKIKVVGYRPPDETYRYMKQIFDAVQEAKGNGVEIETPEEVMRYLAEVGEPEAVGIEMPVPTEEWSTVDGRAGVEVRLDRLPRGCKALHIWTVEE